MLGAAVSTFTQQGTGRIIAGVVALVSVMALLWWLRRPLRAVTRSDSEPAMRPSLRGLLHFDVDEPLYERKPVLDTLYGRTTARGARVNIVLGDAHCGKTSLLLAGLVTALEHSADQQSWVPVYVAHPGHIIEPTWDVEAAIIEALARASGTPTGGSMSDALARAVAAKPAATFVIVYDQFEQFCLANPRPESRASLLEWVGACVRDDDLAVRFVFGVRTGFEAYVAELGSAIGQPISVNFQTPVSRFDRGEARRALDATLNAASARLRGTSSRAEQTGCLPSFSSTRRSESIGWRRPTSRGGFWWRCRGGDRVNTNKRCPETSSCGSFRQTSPLRPTLARGWCAVRSTSRWRN